tara:strand:- start:144 stop:857 length:714 start_codon:yes stop_codon:yes gene_type:complete
MARGSVPFRTYSTNDFIKRFSHLAQTSQFRAVIQAAKLPFLSKYNPQGGRFTEDLSILCNATNLPGSRFSTTENAQDYYGVNQKFAYRRDFDNLTLNFYVDNQYDIINFFEEWMDYIGSPNDTNRYGVIGNPKLESAFYRFRYPEQGYGYKCTIDLHKFDKDYETVNAGSKQEVSDVPRTGGRNGMVYTFINAFPLSINSMPVSYNNTDTLKCSVNFVYDRYFVNRNRGVVQHQDAT